MTNWTKYGILLAIAMVITGAINTLSTKWADMIVSKGYNNNPHTFNHPFIQSCGMFLGEMLCIVTYKIMRLYQIRQNRNREINPINNINTFSPLIFLPPAMFDMTATSLMYMALIFTYASSFQMLRGSVIVFTGLISVAFLGNHLGLRKWAGIFVIISGLMLVGLSDVLTSNANISDRNAIITGDMLIILAQIIVACQVCYEEKFITRYDVHPLQAVGWEGIFGFLILSFFIVLLNFIPLSASTHSLFPHIPGTRMVIEDVTDAFYQIKNSPALMIALLGNILSIAVFNYAGIAVTKSMNATTRMVLDSMRTLLIWIVSLSLRWQAFHYLQLIGFTFLILGMVVYERIYGLLPSCQNMRRQNLLGNNNTMTDDDSTDPLFVESED